MRKILILALAIAFSNAYGQGNTLYSGEMVTPKMGKSAAFEKAWKAHLAKFHSKSDARHVFEILSGDNTGSYLLFEGPTSYADMDKTRPNSEAHGMDFDNNVIPYLEKVTGNDTWRQVDSLSYNNAEPAEKSITTLYNVKYGKGPDLNAEIKRALAINKIIKSPSSYTTYIKVMAGSHPQYVIVSNLKDGFKQLDDNFAPMGTAFKDAYIKEYGQEMWDKRIKLLPEITESVIVYLSKYRKDLSTVMK